MDDVLYTESRVYARLLALVDAKGLRPDAVSCDTSCLYWLCVDTTEDVHEKAVAVARLVPTYSLVITTYKIASARYVTLLSSYPSLARCVLQKAVPDPFVCLYPVVGIEELRQLLDVFVKVATTTTARYIRVTSRNTLFRVPRVRPLRSVLLRSCVAEVRQPFVL